VILEAQGALPAQSRADEAGADSQARRKTRLEAATAAAKRSDLDPVAQPAGAPAARTATPAKIDDDYEDEDELHERGPRRGRQPRHRIDDAEETPSGDRKLNKTDRKALRREKEKQRRGELG
jgi:hypothetical protein